MANPYDPNDPYSSNPLDSYDPSVYGPFAYTPANVVNITDADVTSNKYTLDQYGITVQALRDELFGIDTTDPSTGKPMSDDFYQQMLYLALDKAEKELDVCVIPRILTENMDYNAIEWQNYQFMQLNYRPVLNLEHVSLTYLSQQVFDFPLQWTRTYRLSGQVQIFPNLLLQATGNLNLNSMSFASLPMLGVLPIDNQNSAPQLLQLKYIAGMLPQSTKGVQREWEIHPSFARLVLKMAAIEVFQKFAKIILPPGISSYSTEIDGVLQQVNTIQSPETLYLLLGLNTVNL